MNTARLYCEMVAKIEKDIRPDLQFPGIASFVLEFGREFTFAELPSEIRRGPMKMCYLNAFRLGGPDLTYVEGYATGIIPVMHAWVSPDNLSAYDVTWESGDSYFGIPWNWDFVVEVALETGCAGVLSFEVPSEIQIDLFRNGPPSGAIG